MVVIFKKFVILLTLVSCFRIHELESRLSKLSQAERAEDAKQKELIHGLKIENVDLNMKIAELEREMVTNLQTLSSF